jgi:murein L,D-transpeptidase YafK
MTNVIIIICWLVGCGTIVSLALDGIGQAPTEYRIIIKKSARRLELYEVHNGSSSLKKSYVIALGSQPRGHKREQGDGATPEGAYYITHKNERSKFHLSLGLSYPNLSDAEGGLTRGLITRREREQIVEAIRRGGKPPQGTKLGGDIFIHGGGTETDWTAGCIAVGNKDIEELFALLPIRTPVTIQP